MGRRGKPLQRAGSSRSEQRRFLIYCEGERTEDQYFKGLKQELKSLPVTICLGGDHGEPKSLVRSAIKHKERAAQSAADRYTPYDEVWCVVDVEAPIPHPSLDQALKLAQQAGVNMALSNPCFELWILLHLKRVSAYQTSDSMQTALEKAVDCGYTVQRKHLDYAKLRGSDDARYIEAKERAEKLRTGSGIGHRANPWTNVDMLVELLRQGQVRP
ncbi:RloB domain-containing protein [Kitasatospora xanthocidica]|uniref:RloB domain-containing protein n=1 Tax=Kitasatospora xanthocidica TaxID=83382 RepID=A0A372ZZU2_9ACTN|nr:RloB family protein [Kitasatospora xanthocidica]RGD60900.1 RloB domain-containing protein [Kitasatospora xanthocidica]